MSLDQNLFTLAIAASADETGALDLTDPATNTVYYRKRVNPGDPENPYSWGLYGTIKLGQRGRICAHLLRRPFIQRLIMHSNCTECIQQTEMDRTS